MPNYSRVVKLAVGIILTCCFGTIAYGTSITPQYKLKNETENLLAGANTPEIQFLSIEEELFYAAMKSTPDDQFKTGLLFGRGEDVKRDFSKCITLLEKAAEQGYVDASFLLGTIFLKGGSLFKEIKTDIEYAGIIIPGEFPYDISKAFHYYLISGNKGDKLSHDLCCIIKKQLLDSGENTINANKMLQELETSANNGNALAQRFLAELYSEGRLVKQDDSTAFDLFQESAEHGDEWAQYNTARKYIAGLGVKQDVIKGFEWMKKAAEHNLSVAQFDLSVLYYLGTGTVIDKKMGYVWLLIAKENGHEEAASLVSEADNGGLTTEEEKTAHEIAAKIFKQISTTKESGRLLTTLSKL